MQKKLSMIFLTTKAFHEQLYRQLLRNMKSKEKRPLGKEVLKSLESQLRIYRNYARKCLVESGQPRFIPDERGMMLSQHGQMINNKPLSRLRVLSILQKRSTIDMELWRAFRQWALFIARQRNPGPRRSIYEQKLRLVNRIF